MWLSCRCLIPRLRGIDRSIFGVEPRRGVVTSKQLRFLLIDNDQLRTSFHPKQVVALRIWSLMKIAFIQCSGPVRGCSRLLQRCIGVWSGLQPREKSKVVLCESRVLWGGGFIHFCTFASMYHSSKGWVARIGLSSIYAWANNMEEASRSWKRHTRP